MLKTGSSFIFVLLIVNSFFGCAPQSVSQETSTSKVERRIQEMIKDSLNLADPRFGVINESLDILNEISAIAPDKYYLVKFNAALIYYKSNQISQAISSLKEAIELNQDFGNPHFHLGKILLKERLLEQAVEHFKSAIKIYNRKIKRFNVSNDVNETREEMILNRALSYAQIGQIGYLMNNAKMAIPYTHKASILFLRIKDPTGNSRETALNIKKTIGKMLQKYNFNSIREVAVTFPKEFVALIDNE